MIITRYLNREVLNTLLAVTLVLLLVFLSDRLVRYLNYAAAGKIPAYLLLKLIGLEIPYYVALLLPLGLYLGIILSYSRMYANNELYILHASRFSIAKLIKVTAWIALTIAGIAAALMFWLNPYIASQKAKLLLHSVNLLDTLQPGRFHVANEGARVVYMEKISRDHKRAKNIFIADQFTDKNQNTGWRILAAEKGYQAKDVATKNRYVVADHGIRYEGIAGFNDYKIIEFKKYAIRVPVELIKTTHTDLETQNTATLWKNLQNPQSAAEFHWRLAIPISTLILMLVAVPFSRVNPRQGRFAKIIPALLIYVIYINLLFVGRNFLEQCYVPTSLGLWWVHAVLLVIFGVVIFWQRKARV